MYSANNPNDEILRLRAENEKLQWELGKALDTLVVHDAVCAENEKLRAEVREADVMLLNQARTIRDYQDAAAALKETGDGKREEWLNPNLDIENFRARLNAMGNPITEQLQTDSDAALKDDQ